MTEHKETAPMRRRLGAIDVGTNSIRLVIAEVDETGSYRVIDDEKITTRLGHGLHETGLLDARRMEASIEAVARFKQIAQGHGVEMLRAVGTCAVREASNGPDMARLCFERAGIALHILPADEEARMAYVSVASAFDLRSISAAVVDIGGGSTEIVLSTNGVIEHVFSLPLGAVRLTEQFGFIQGDGPEFTKMCRHIRRIVEEMVPKPDSPPQLMFGTGGTFTNMAGMSLIRNTSLKSKDLLPSKVRGYELERASVRHLRDWLRDLSIAERANVPGLSPDRADIIVAGIAIADRVMKHLGVNRLRVHDRGVRDGLLLSMIDELNRSSRRTDRSPLTKAQAALQFGRACRFEERHSMHVAHLAISLFDQFRGLYRGAPSQWLTDDARDLLEAAAIMHDVGYLISYEKHHKHSYHLIVHSDIPGFTQRELEIVANIARYHRRAEPKRRHPSFAKLDPNDRRLVKALAGILRIADGLDRTHTQGVTSIGARTEVDTLVLTVVSAEEPSVDVWGAQRKSTLFESMFGTPVRFEWRIDTGEGAGSGAPVRAMSTVLEESNSLN